MHVHVFQRVVIRLLLIIIRGLYTLKDDQLLEIRQFDKEAIREAIDLVKVDVRQAE